MEAKPMFNILLTELTFFTIPINQLFVKFNDRILFLPDINNLEKSIFLNKIQ